MVPEPVAHPAWIVQIDKVRPPYNVSVLNAEATLFADQFVSILDIWSFAEGLLDLAASARPRELERALAALAQVDEGIPRRDAVAAYLHEKNGDLELAARLYADAAHNAPNLAERDHQMRQAARLNQMLRHH